MRKNQQLLFLECCAATFALTVAMTGINTSNKLIVCSIFMVLSLGMGLLMQAKYGRKAAFLMLTLGIILQSLAMVLMGHELYLYSWIPFGCAVFVTGVVFERLQGLFASRTSLTIFLALLCGIGVDGLLIAPWEGMVFGFDRLPWIIIKSLTFKTLYAALLSFLTACVYDFKVGQVRFLKTR